MSEERFTVRCPHCSASIEHECPPAGETLPGSPLRKCPDCGRLFYDDGYQEPALKAYAAASVKFSWIKVLYAAVPTAGALFYLSVYLKNHNAMSSVLAIVFGVVAVFFDVLLALEIVKAIRQKRKLTELERRLNGPAEALTEEERASMERLSSKAYLDALDKCGDDVADWFYFRLGEKPREKSLREKLLS